MKRIVILGGGTGGTMMANRLARALPSDGWRVTVIDRDDLHVYQPGLLFLPFGQYRPEEILRPRARLLDPHIELHLGEIDRIAPTENAVFMKGGARFGYDVLVVATGSRILPEQTDGLTGPGWKTRSRCAMRSIASREAASS
jgi:sulfide:quinone oxidoreductase